MMGYLLLGARNHGKLHSQMSLRSVPRTLQPVASAKLGKNVVIIDFGI